MNNHLVYNNYQTPKSNTNKKVSQFSNVDNYLQSTKASKYIPKDPQYSQLTYNQNELDEFLKDNRNKILSNKAQNNKTNIFKSVKQIGKSKPNEGETISSIKNINTTKNNAKNIYRELLSKKTPAKPTNKIEIQGSMISDTYKRKKDSLENNHISILERKNTYGTPLNYVGNNIHHAKNAKTISTLNKNKSLASNLNGKLNYNKPINKEQNFSKHGSALRLNNTNLTSTNKNINNSIQNSAKGKSIVSKMTITPKNNTKLASNKELNNI